MSSNTPLSFLKIIEKKNLWFLISTIVITMGFGMMGARSIQTLPAMNMGIDFIGGSTFLLAFDDTDLLSENKYETIEKARAALSNISLEGSQIQLTSDGEMIIKTTATEPESVQNIQQTLNSHLPAFTTLEIDFIGPTIGHELRQSSFWIIGSICVLLLLYISWRFEWIYGISALVALLHDALVTISIAALLSIEINTAFVAALLTILGYSINDTIIIFDRIRENSHHKTHQKLPFNTLINLSLSQTFMRTINTSLTTLGVVSLLFLFGGVTLSNFSLVLLIGIVSGTYSSLCIAAPTLFQLHNRHSLQK